MIPAYNAAETIERALNSVYAQTYPNIVEVIVVDDGSTDNTAKIVPDKFPGVTLIQQENRGVSGARNAGVQVASGEWIAFLDADDEWLPEKLEAQFGALRTNPKMVLVTCAAMVCAEPSQDDCGTCAPSADHSLFQLIFHGVLHRDLPAGLHFCCSGWVVRREVFIAESGLDEGLSAGEDWEFLLRLSGQGYSVGAVLAPLYRYHVLPDSVSNSPAGRRDLCRLDLEIIRRYDPAGEGWQSKLLTPEEYRALLRHTYFAQGWVLWGLRGHDHAREYLRLARDLSGGGACSWLQATLAAACPSLYWYCRAAYFRVASVRNRRIGH